MKYLSNIFHIGKSEDNRLLLVNFLGIKIKIRTRNFPHSIIIDKFKTKYPHFLSVATMIKNEGPYIKEWIEYHNMLGVEKFYIFDNGSTDNTKEILDPYIEKGIVEYIFFPGEQKQYEAFDKAIKISKYQTKWLGILDLDEFIVPVKWNSITEFLNDFKDVYQVGIHWVNFDSNGHQEKPEGLVIENYTRIKTDDSCKLIKSIVNPRWVEIADVHTCKLFFNKKTVNIDKKGIAESIPEDSEFKNFCNKDILYVQDCSDRIRINHYWSKSIDEYTKRVSKGGFLDKTNFDKSRCIFEGETKQDTAVLKYLNELKKRMN